MIKNHQFDYQYLLTYQLISKACFLKKKKKPYRSKIHKSLPQSPSRIFRNTSSSLIKFILDYWCATRIDTHANW